MENSPIKLQKLSISDFKKHPATRSKIQIDNFLEKRENLPEVKKQSLQSHFVNLQDFQILPNLEKKQKMDLLETKFDQAIQDLQNQL